MPPLVYFVRHGETEWNAQGRLQGQRDIVLNGKGRSQAREAARKLRNLRADVHGLDFVASPLRRTRETMALLREELGLAPFAHGEDPRLREIHFGSWEGSTWDEIRARDPERAAARDADKWGYVPPGGESYAMLAARIAPFLDSLSRDTVVVSHGGVARAMLALRCGLPPERAPHLDIWQGRVLLLAGDSWRWI